MAIFYIPNPTQYLNLLTIISTRLGVIKSKITPKIKCDQVTVGTKVPQWKSFQGLTVLNISWLQIDLVFPTWLQVRFYRNAISQLS